MAVAALFAAVTCLAVLQGSSASLEQAFAAATAPLPPPDHSVYFAISNATATKLQLEAVFQAYLADMGMTVDMMAARTLTGLYQQESNYFKDWQYLYGHPELLTATAYDSSLPYVAALYRRIAGLVKNGASAASRTTHQVAPKLQKQAYSQWSPENVYVNLPDVIDNGLSELRSWVNDFLDTGLSASNSEVAAILKQKREESLFPYVKSAQSTAIRARDWYEDNFQKYSSPEVYQNFVAARDELLNVQLVA